MSVSFTSLLNRVRPKDHIDVLRSALPSRYSPLQTNGNGNQALYLTERPQDFAEVLGGLIGEEARTLMTKSETLSPVEAPRMVANDDLDVWGHGLEEQVQTDSSVQETDREAIIRARCGQGLFKQRVMLIEQRCRITGVNNLTHLMAIRNRPTCVRPGRRTRAMPNSTTQFKMGFV